VIWGSMTAPWGNWVNADWRAQPEPNAHCCPWPKRGPAGPATASSRQAARREGLRPAGTAGRGPPPIAVQSARKGIETFKRLGRDRWIVEVFQSLLLRDRRLIRQYGRKPSISKPSPTPPVPCRPTVACSMSSSEPFPTWLGGLTHRRVGALYRTKLLVGQQSTKTTALSRSSVAYVSCQHSAVHP